MIHQSPYKKINLAQRYQVPVRLVSLIKKETLDVALAMYGAQ
jgi:hypothetical protein